MVTTARLASVTLSVLVTGVSVSIDHHCPPILALRRRKIPAESVALKPVVVLLLNEELVVIHLHRQIITISINKIMFLLLLLIVAHHSSSRHNPLRIMMSVQRLRCVQSGVLGVRILVIFPLNSIMTVT